MNVRRIVVMEDRVFVDPYGKSAPAVTRAAAIAVVKNPFAGRHQDDLSALFNYGKDLGEMLSGKLVGLLPGAPVSYGKAAIVGAAGDVEHGGAIIHPKLGKPIRAAVGGGAALIPSNVKIGAPGCPIDVPLGHKDEAWSFAHFDTLTVSVADAPLADEIAVVLAFADGGRMNPRVGTGPITD